MTHWISESSLRLVAHTLVLYQWCHIVIQVRSSSFINSPVKYYTAILILRYMAPKSLRRS